MILKNVSWMNEVNVFVQACIDERALVLKWQDEKVKI